LRIAIFGSGGVGAYFGGRLALANNDVTFIARGAHLDAIRLHGLRVTSVRGDFHLPKVQVTDDPACVGKVDLVLLGVKTWQVEAAAHAIKPLLAPGTTVMTMQNGVEAPEILADVLGAEYVLPGAVKLFTQVIAPAHIEHIGGPASIAFGEWNGALSERVQRLRSAFGHAEVSVEVAADIRRSLWEKFLFVTAMGGVGAVCHAPVGVLRELPQTRSMLEQCMAETAYVARTHGVTLAADVVAKTMSFIDAQPAQGISSLQRDIEAGRVSELEAWNGAVVRFAGKVDVQVPTHTFLYHALLPRERKARAESGFEVGCAANPQC
jgi:2-dehydropantoate 2-reductase